MTPCSCQIPGFETINSDICLISAIYQGLIARTSQHHTPYTFLRDIESGTAVHLLVTPGRCPLQRRVPLQASQPMPIIVGIVVIRVQQAHLYCFLSPLDLALFSPTCGMLNPDSINDNSYLTVVPKGSLLVSNIAFDTTGEIASYATKRQGSL